MPRRERAVAAALFALAGAGAAALHVMTETPGALRDWRQTLPLAAALGGAVGWAFAPAGAVRGALATAAALVAFAVLFALGHAIISGGGAAAALMRTLGVILGPAGAAALALGALAGWATPRLAPLAR